MAVVISLWFHICCEYPLVSNWLWWCLCCCRDDVVFRDPMNTFEGIDNYKLVFWALRFHGRIFFKALWVDIVRVWQPSDKVIMVRWTVRGIPRVPWETQGHFDGTSEYKLDKDGRIYEHKVDNVIMNSHPKFQPQSVLDLVRVAGGHTTPTPSFFQRAGIFFCLLSPYLQQFTWVRFYWALKSTLALTSAGDWCSELVPSLNSWFFCQDAGTSCCRKNPNSVKMSTACFLCIIKSGGQLCKIVSGGAFCDKEGYGYLLCLYILDRVRWLSRNWNWQLLELWFHARWEQRG